MVKVNDTMLIDNYLFIPEVVRYDKDLTANEKLLYGEIARLSAESGYCNASNNQLASLFSVTRTAVTRWIRELEDKKYIGREILYRPGTKEIEERRIYLLEVGGDS